MWRSVLFFSSLLWCCGLVLASRLGDPGLFIFREKLKQLQLDVVMQSSRRTQRLGTGEPGNIIFQLTSTWIACLWKTSVLCVVNWAFLPPEHAPRSSNGSKKQGKPSEMHNLTPNSKRWWQHRTPATISAVTTRGPGPAEPQLLWRKNALRQPVDLS